MTLVSLNCLLINIEKIITSFTPYSKHFFAMSIIRIGMLFASILLIVLCVIPFVPTWIITMPGRSSSKIGVIKWSNLLMVTPLKLDLPSLIKLLNNFLFNSLYMTIAHDTCLLTMLRSTGVRFITRNSSYQIFTLCVAFVCCYCIR